MLKGQVLEVTRLSEDITEVEIARVDGEDSVYVFDAISWEDLVALLGDCVEDMKLGESRGLIVIPTE